MKVEFKESLFEIENYEVEEKISIKTGKTLRNIKGRVRIDNEYNPKSFNNLKKINIQISEEVGNFKLKINSSSNSSVLSYWTFDIFCEEIEEYKVSKIFINKDIELEPYEYKEDVDNKALIIELKTIVNEEIFFKIKEMHKQSYLLEEKKYFNVKRNNMIEKEMRFGQPRWQKVNDNEYKLFLIIVEKSYDFDVHKVLRINEPDFTNLKKMLSENKSRLNSLIKLLENKGIINKEETLLFKDSFEFDYAEDIFLLKQVKDINED